VTFLIIMPESLRHPIQRLKSKIHGDDEEDYIGSETNAEGLSTATQAESIRHPIQRGHSKLQKDGNESSDHLLKPEDAISGQDLTPVSSQTPSDTSSRPSPLRHPLQRTKTKLLEYEQKKITDPETLAFIRAQPPEERHQTVYKNKMARPRWVLHVQAQFWRVLMGLGMFFHKMASPRPPKYNFVRTIPATISNKTGTIDLYFYTPMGYGTQKSLWQGRSASDDEETVDKGKQRKSSIGSLGQNLRRRSSSAKRWGGYPVVLNFHGGGFTLGSPMDDARWCTTVVDECNAVVISVDYRRAPEMPFPTAVEDGVDAVIWVHQHAEELGIDPNKIALSGFSSGANMACTIPLRLWDEMMGFPREDESPRLSTSNESPEPSAAKFSQEARVETIDPSKPPPPLNRSPLTKHNIKVREDTLRQVSDISLRAIVPWYPSLDYTRTREQRRATCSRKDQELPALFTDLFDESYVHVLFLIPVISLTKYSQLPPPTAHNHPGLALPLSRRRAHRPSEKRPPSRNHHAHLRMGHAARRRPSLPRPPHEPRDRQKRCVQNDRRRAARLGQSSQPVETYTGRERALFESLQGVEEGVW
jgi:hypothetical protein